jgi:hypothetical protein
MELAMGSGAAVNLRMGNLARRTRRSRRVFVDWSVAPGGHSTSSAILPQPTKTAFSPRIVASSRESTRQWTKPSVPSVSSVRDIPIHRFAATPGLVGNTILQLLNSCNS